MHDELTKVDIQKMQEEIEYRKHTLMPKLKEALVHARELGDLSENDEYRSAKRDLGRNNSRIAYLQQMIDTAVVVDVEAKKEGTAGLFDKITLWLEEDEEEMTIVLVTTLRQDSFNGFISKESPLGAAVIGHRVGDRVLVKVNDNYSYYVEIRAIEKGKDDDSLQISSY